MTAIFGPQNSNAATALPSGTAQQRYGSNQTWVQDCSAPGRNDGTVLDASFYNRIIGNLDYLLSQSGVTATPSDFSNLYRAILGTVANGAPELLNSIKELADAIGDDPNFAVTVLTQMGLRIRVDAPQLFSDAQKAQALSNLGISVGTGPKQVLILDNVGKLPVVDGSALTNIMTTWGNVSGKPAFGTAALLNVGVAANNVVQLDGTGKLPPMDGSQLSGVLAASTSAVVFNGPQSLTDAQRLQALANLGMPMECGRLRFSSSLLLVYLPFKGDLLKINGAVVRIPSTGIVGLSNTNAFANGVAAQNLQPNTLYYVYAFMNGGVLTADFCTASHNASATAGNGGTEVKAGDDTRSLIGMVQTNASSQFTNALTLSWFNRRTRALSAPVLNTASPGMYPLEVGGGASQAVPGARIYFLVWGDENEVQVAAMANVSQSGGNANVCCQIDIDGAGVGPQTLAFNTTSNNICTSAVTSASLAEGPHYAVILGGHNNGTAIYNSYQTTVSGIRG